LFNYKKRGEEGMNQLEEIEDEIFETMDLMIQAYKMFNEVLKQDHFAHKAIAASLMDQISKQFKIDVREKEEKIASIRDHFGSDALISDEEAKVKEEKFKSFTFKVEEYEKMMEMTAKNLKKHFPLNNRAQEFKKKRNRLRKMRSKGGK